MNDVLVLEAEITTDGRLLVELPPDAPRGPVRITVTRRVEEAGAEADASVALTGEMLTGRGKTADQIARSPYIGMLAGSGIPDGKTYVEKLREQIARRHQA